MGLRPALTKLLGAKETGLVLVIAALTVVLILMAGTHPDRVTGRTVNNFWNT